MSLRRIAKQNEREAASSVIRIKLQGQKQTRLKRAHRKRENSMINIKTEKGNSRFIINGQAIEIKAEIIQCFISLAENMATINKTSVESAALMIYQVGMSSYANFKGKHKEKTCTENPETNTSAESGTSDAAKEKHSH